MPCLASLLQRVLYLDRNPHMYFYLCYHYEIEVKFDGPASQPCWMNALYDGC